VRSARILIAMLACAAVVVVPSAVANASLAPDPTPAQQLPLGARPYTPNVLHDQAYGPDPAQRFDLYRPARGAGPWPLVVWVHGGGWVGGRRADTYPHIQREVELGRVAVASVDYRVAPRYPFPIPLQDVKRAVRYLKANAARLHVRADKVVIAGHSAGANLAMMVAVTPGVMEPPNLPSALRREHSDVAGVVSFAGPSDLVGFWKHSAWGVPLTQQYLACANVQAGPLARRRDAAVATWLDARDPPAYLVLGQLDPIVPDETEGRPLYAKWRGLLGDKVVYDVAEGEGHVPWRINMATFESWLAKTFGLRFAPAPAAAPK